MEPLDTPASGRQSQLPPEPFGTRNIDAAAVLGGAILTIAIGLLSTGFGAALGLTALSPEPAEGSGTWALLLTALWMLLSMVAAYATGGYVAGRMRRQSDAAKVDELRVRDGMNGLVVWGLGTVASALVLGALASTTLSTAGNVAASAAGAAGDAVGLVAGALTGDASGATTPDPMLPVVRRLLRPATVTPVTAGRAGTEAEVAMLLTTATAQGAMADDDRSYLVAVTAVRSGLTAAEADARVQQALDSAQSVRQDVQSAADQAKETARQAAETARISAILTAFLLTAAALVSAVAAYGAAVVGGRHRDEGRLFGGFAWRR